ncbi:phosphate-import permease protein PhnE [Desulfosporosinus acididurans]|uniref:Phosphate-import permease protein PhnE n=1 Tax=Desulfosporosinus acididurans TaxID=476652 RepID=A0A0J1FT30_9FIRM|nr:ABC transporter permease subunit [Desulfosporosinus acididurans]KLU66625.1 phosphate-import permease protein PhnE [Desulfosporosinus acididurans]
MKKIEEAIIPSKPLTRESFTMWILLLVLSLLTIYALATIDYTSVDMGKAMADTLNNFKTIFFHPAAHRLSLWDAFYEVLITMGLAFLTTLFGGIIAMLLGLLAAQNLAPKQVTNIIKGFVAFIRAVPSILWVLIFAVAAGLGSVAAVIGLTFHSVSYLTKAYSESFEELDRSVIEALMASGANWWQIIFQAVIPSSVSSLLSWTFMRFEINFANAVAMGAAAGAAGIGFDLFMDSGFYFDLREIGLVTYFIIAFALVLETISTNLKSKILLKKA